MMPYAIRASFLLLNFGLIYLVLNEPKNALFYRVIEIVTLSSFFSLACQFGSGNLFKTFKIDQLGRQSVVAACYLSLLLNVVCTGLYYAIFNPEALFSGCVFLLTQFNLSSTFIGHYFRVNNNFTRFVVFSSWASPIFIVAYISTADLMLTVSLLGFLTVGVLLGASKLPDVAKSNDLYIAQRVYLAFSQVTMACIAIFLVENAVVAGAGYFSAQNFQVFIRLLQSSPSIQSFFDIKMWNKILRPSEKASNRIHRLVALHTVYGALCGMVLCASVSVGAILLVLCLTLVICLAFLNVGFTYVPQNEVRTQVGVICLGGTVVLATIFLGDEFSDIAQIYRLSTLFIVLLLFRLAQMRLLISGVLGAK